MADHAPVTVEFITPAVALVMVHRPPNNFLELPIITGVAEAYESIAQSAAARVIVLASEGKHFCAGGDFSGYHAGGGTATAAGFGGEAYAQAARLMAAPLPVVAAVQGAAVGGGLGLACTADFRVGAPETRLAPNFSQLGIHHGFGLTVTLPRIVGQQRATELLLTGRRVGGEEGLRLGLLDRLVAAAEVAPAAIAFAHEIASAAPLSIRAIRATLRQGLVEQFRAATERESLEQGKLSGTDDFREGVRATAERRPPRFVGH